MEALRYLHFTHLNTSILPILQTRAVRLDQTGSVWSGAVRGPDPRSYCYYRYTTVAMTYLKHVTEV